MIDELAERSTDVGKESRDTRDNRDTRESNEPSDDVASFDAETNAKYEQVKGGKLYIKDLQQMDVLKLHEIAKQEQIPDYIGLKKQDLIFQILRSRIRQNGLMYGEGVLEILPDGFGFLRSPEYNYLPCPDDIYISQSQIRRFELRRGDLVAGQVRRPKDNEKYYGIVKVETVNGYDPESIRTRRTFEDLNAMVPTQRWKLAVKGDAVTRSLDLFAPLGKGQRVLITVPPRVDATSTLAAIARGILTNAPDAHVIVLSIDGRPEDAAALQRRIDGEIVATTFDEHPDHHVATAELVMERAKRLVELGSDVVILLDSLSRLARAFGTGAAQGRPINDFTVAAKPKRYFGAARACEEGGSLTIVATVAIDGPSQFDAVVAEEATAIANGEIALSRELAQAGVEPPIDVRLSATRDDELLLSEAEANKVRELRSGFAKRSSLDVAATIAGEVLAR